MLPQEVAASIWEEQRLSRWSSCPLSLLQRLSPHPEPCPGHCISDRQWPGGLRVKGQQGNPTPGSELPLPKARPAGHPLFHSECWWCPQTRRASHSHRCKHCSSLMRCSHTTVVSQTCDRNSTTVLRVISGAHQGELPGPGGLWKSLSWGGGPWGWDGGWTLAPCTSME